MNIESGCFIECIVYNSRYANKYYGPYLWSKDVITQYYSLNKDKSFKNFNIVKVKYLKYIEYKNKIYILEQEATKPEELKKYE